MIASQWQLGLLIAVLAVHLIAIGYAYRHRDAPLSASTSTPRDDAVDREAGTVACQDCGAENELGYRYCRSCVAELPMSMRFDGGTDSPLGRIAR